MISPIFAGEYAEGHCREGIGNLVEARLIHMTEESFEDNYILFHVPCVPQQRVCSSLERNSQKMFGKVRRACLLGFGPWFPLLDS